MREMILTHHQMRGLASIGGLFLFLVIEKVAPFRRPVGPILHRYAANLLILAGNAGVTGAMSGIVMAYAQYLSDRGIGLLHFFKVSLSWDILLSLLYLDFVTYLWHIAFHRLPFLWRLHRVHHSDRMLDVTSASRFHPGEIFVSILIKIGMITLWGPAWISVVIFEGILLAAAQFNHSNTQVPFDSAIRRIFVTPDMHRIHHSEAPAETNSNYGTIFPFWDRLFTTYKSAPQEGIVFGLSEYPAAWKLTVRRLILMPFDAACGKEIPATKACSFNN